MVNLATKFSKQIKTFFAVESLIAGRLSTEYDFAGAKTVKVLTPVTVPMVDYQRAGTNRYGTPQEMQDILQELTLTQDKSFALTIDTGNYEDQMMLKQAGRMLKLQMRERAIPTMDKYVFAQLALKAGKIVGNSTALSKTTICDRISAGTTALDDAEVPQDNRTLFVDAAGYAMLKHSDEFLAVDKLGEKAIAKGQVGLYDNMTVIKVPKGRWPANVNFMIVYKNSAIAPTKLNETRMHKNPPGISGVLLEGRQYYDCFVFGAKCDGVYVEVVTGSGKGTICATPTQTDGTFASTTTGCTFKYTEDGSDPRYSGSAKIGASEAAAAGTTIKVVAYKDGCFPSAILEYAAT